VDRQGSRDLKLQALQLSQSEVAQGDQAPEPGQPQGAGGPAGAAAARPGGLAAQLRQRQLRGALLLAGLLPAGLLLAGLLLAEPPLVLLAVPAAAGAVLLLRRRLRARAGRRQRLRWHHLQLHHAGRLGQHGVPPHQQQLVRRAQVQQQHVGVGGRGAQEAARPLRLPARRHQRRQAPQLLVLRNHLEHLDRVWLRSRRAGQARPCRRPRRRRRRRRRRRAAELDAQQAAAAAVEQRAGVGGVLAHEPALEQVELRDLPGPQHAL
jgi:hypothetical protein